MSDTRIEVPDIGDASDVDVVEVLVQPGARVTKDQSLIVLESDKASMEVPSPRAGVVREVALKAGDKVKKGSLILTMDADGEGAQPAASGKASQVQPEASATTQAEPKVAAPAGKQATTPAAASTAALPATRSATPEIPPPPPPPAVPSEPPSSSDAKPHASPSVRRFARELGVDLAQVSGTGPHQRVSNEDVQRYVKHAMSLAGTATGSGFAVPGLPEIDFNQFGNTTVQPLTKIQKLSGRNLHRSWVTIPHVTQFDEADITELEAFRKKMRAERPEVKLTLTSFFMKAVVAMLKQMPRFNASLDKTGENLVLKHYFHIGVAVDTPNGLVVPVIRDVDVKGLHDLAVELADVSERARARRLSAQDLQGASITISSLGGIGGTHFTPIINPPEVAVLGVSRAIVKPVYHEDQLMPRLMCRLSLSYDHRVIDGADGARFTTRLREVLGDIREMLL